jgi:glycosidase
MSSTEETPYDRELIVGKATPIQLFQDITIVNLADYVLAYDQLDSITVPKELNKSIADKLLTLTGNLNTRLANLSFWKSGQHYDVLLKQSNKKRHQLVFDGSAETVKAKGEFNAWNQENTVLEKENGTFNASLTLNPGIYQYLLVVDGQEVLDPANPDSVSNGMGGWNSVINLPRAEQSVLPWLTTQASSPLTITLSTSNTATGVFAYWENYQIQNLVNTSNSLEFQIPPYAKDMERSHIRVWAYNEAGVSNDVLIPLHYGKVIASTADLSRKDKEANILYFLMVDRFNNGNKSNDSPIADPNVHPKANYYGGDLKGVTQKIEDGYFQSLGITTIWLSPISQNPEGAYGKYPNPKTTFSGYHGYWPISSSKVDHRFGTAGELKDLLAKAHARGMNVILDYVANHVHEEHPLYQEHKDWATPLYLPDGTMNTERWDDHRLTTWFDTFLPTLDLSRPEIVDPMTDSALYWLKSYDFDGFRHDATKHIPLLFWRELTKKTKSQVIIPQQKTVFQIGETYGSRELINSYINTGMLDGQFDFNVYDDAVQTFANPTTSFARLANSIKESIAYYGHHNLMGYITGNQDRARFISYADGSVRFDEDAKLAGWTRQIDVTDTTAYQKLNMLTAFMMTIPGLPVIYYGDEIGSPGGNDPDNRRMMRFENVSNHENKSRAITKKLISQRRENLALIYGDFEIVESTQDLMIIKRRYFDQAITVVFNKSAETRSITLSISPNKEASTVFGHSLNQATLELPPYSFEFIKQ